MKKIFLFGLIMFLGGSLVVSCKKSNTPLGIPNTTGFDIPTSSPTVTSTPGSTNLIVNVNYPSANTVGVGFALVDPSGNTLATSTTNNTGTPLVFNPTTFGVYQVAVTAQGLYGYSTTPVTVNSVGNYSANFTASGFSIAANPTSYSYLSAIGYQIPITVSYSQTGNLNIPVSVVLAGLPSAFGQSQNYLMLNNNGASAAVTLYRNACYVNNTSLQFIADRLDGTNVNSTNFLPITRAYSIPVTVFYSYTYANEVGGTCGSAILGNVQVNFTVFDQDLNCSSGTPYTFYGSGNADTNNANVQFNNSNSTSTFSFGQSFPINAPIAFSELSGAGASPGGTSNGFSLPVTFAYPGGQINTNVSFPNVFCPTSPVSIGYTYSGGVAHPVTYYYGSVGSQQLIATSY
jgi:hypothetical protein